MNNENNGQKSGVNADPGKKGAHTAGRATGRGLKHGKNGAKKAGRKAKRGLKKAPRKAKNLKNSAEKAAGMGARGAGLGAQGVGKGTNLAGKGIQGASKALNAIPYAGPALSAVGTGIGKGVSGAGKGMDKAGKHLGRAGKKLQKHANRKKRASKGVGMPAKIVANIASHGMWIVSGAAVIIFIVLLGYSFTASISDMPECNPSNSSSDDSGAITGTISSGGTWPQKGSRDYNLLKSVFLAAKKLGFNDAGAAGAVGNAYEEGGGPLNVKGDLDYHELDADNGEGIYQFTPSTQGGYTLEKYKSWCSSHGYKPWQSAYVETKGIMAIKGMPKSKEQASSPTQGARNFYFSCEDGIDNGTLEHGPQGMYSRQEAAQKAYSEWKGQGGSSSDAESTADSGGSSDSSSTCGSDTGGGDSADGTGSVKEAVWSCWKPSELPDDVKKYAHDPTKVGLKYGSTKGWSDVGEYAGQCVNFANSYFHAIWGLKQPYAMGMGGDMANAWNGMIDGTESKTPHAGAIAGTHESKLTGGGGPGHTFIVEHVFSNGDYLIAEENMTWAGKGYSGTYLHGYNSQESTWNYQLLPKDLPSTQYFLPNSKKYHLNWGK